MDTVNRAIITGLTMTVITLLAMGAAFGEEPAAPAWSKRLQDLTKTEKLTIEGKGYFRYVYDIQDAAQEGTGEDEAHDNSFELWRFYFGVKSKVTPWLKMRFTLDIGPEKDTETTEDVVDENPPDGVKHGHEVTGDARYQAFVKYAWLEAKLHKSVHLRAGVLDNPYHGVTDKFWGYRYVFKNIGDEEKLWNSADVGAYLRYELPAEIGEVFVGAVNGAGYKHAWDEDGNKDLWLSTILRPFKPLGGVGEMITLGAIVMYPMPLEGDAERRVFVSGFAGVKHRFVTAGYQAVIDMKNGVNDDDTINSDETVTGLGHAAYLRVDTPCKVGLLSRFVVWDTNSDKDEARTKYQALGGISYRPHKLFGVAASGVVTWWSDAAGLDPASISPEDSKDETEITVLLSTEIKF